MGIYNGIQEEELLPIVNNLTAYTYNRYSYESNSRIIDAIAEYLISKQDSTKAFYILTALPRGHHLIDPLILIAIEDSHAAKQILQALDEEVGSYYVIKPNNYTPQQIVKKIIENHPSLYEKMLFRTRQFGKDKEIKKDIINRIMNPEIDLSERVSLGLALIGISGTSSHKAKNYIGTKVKAYKQILDFAIDNCDYIQCKKIINCKKITWDIDSVIRIIRRAMEIDTRGDTLRDIILYFEPKHRNKIDDNLFITCVKKCLELENDRYNSIAYYIIFDNEYRNDRISGLFSKENNMEIWIKSITSLLNRFDYMYDKIIKFCLYNDKFQKEDFEMLPENEKNILREEITKRQPDDTYDYTKVYNYSRNNPFLPALEKGFFNKEHDVNKYIEVVNKAALCYIQKQKMLKFIENHYEVMPKNNYIRLIKALFANKK